MTKDQLLERLEEVKNYGPEAGHVKADEALLEYIDDKEIKAAYKAITRYCS